MDDNQTPNEPNPGLAEAYQSILDKYSQELAVAAPPEPPSPPPEPTIPPASPAPIVPPTLPTPPLPVFPPLVNPEPVVGPPVPPEIPPAAPKISVSSSITLPSPFNSLFKIIFFISLFVFLAVLIGNVYVFFLAKPASPTVGQPTLIPNPTANVVNYCALNDVRYVVDQTFPAQDGCNTCTCLTDLTISCTNNICPTAGPTKKPVPLTVSSVYPSSGSSTDSVTLYGSGFSPTANSVVFAPNNTKINSCSFTFTDQPSADSQKIMLPLTGFSNVNCASNSATIKPTVLVAGVYNVSVNVASASSYVKNKLIKFTVIGSTVASTSLVQVGFPLQNIVDAINQKLKTTYAATVSADKLSTSVDLTKSSTSANLITIKSAITATGLVLQPALSSVSGLGWKEVYAKTADTCDLVMASSKLTLTCHN